ncbi:MAG TPA: MgtC/SapB family protein [Ramlibacter sp.]|uniref:MgtC/SapB family protein n=1 Tax=Ramlibacter sp. TaxID=1917967 RepID=UPI002C286D48|nr:MgtC/SapB family protein [Ramlibacter sp.]HVZ42354.1 MgtC/SapB family protein [Ramlibacter sp.]
MPIWNTLAGEFSDLADAEQFVRLVVRVFLAALLGGLMGLEREIRGKSAGIRTHMLMALSATLIVTIVRQSDLGDDVLGRFVQGLLAGAGLLCAGEILKAQGDERPHGLTTAAGLWMTTAIGVAVGLGREASAVVTTAVGLAILSMDGPIKRWFARRRERGQLPPADS